MAVSRFDIFLVNLDPTVGSEVKKTRRCLIISPPELNDIMHTVIIAPVTSKISKYPMRIQVKVNELEGEIMLDQIRSVDKQRLVKKVGHIRGKTQNILCETLQEMFKK
jgi:mRNA interferase MazF